MAFPASFEESNAVLSRPPDMTSEQCDPLSVALMKEEMDEINRTGRVWLGIAGHTMPPAWVSATSPFSAKSGT